MDIDDKDQSWTWKATSSNWNVIQNQTHNLVIASRKPCSFHCFAFFSVCFCNINQNSLFIITTMATSVMHFSINVPSQRREVHIQMVLQHHQRHQNDNNECQVVSIAVKVIHMFSNLWISFRPVAISSLRWNVCIACVRHNFTKTLRIVWKIKSDVIKKHF